MAEMKVDPAEVEAQNSKFNALSGRMDTTITDLRTLEKALLADFAGASATGYKEVMDRLHKQIDGYNNSLIQLRSAIATATQMIIDADNRGRTRFV